MSNTPEQTNQDTEDQVTPVGSSDVPADDSGAATPTPATPETPVDNTGTPAGTAEGAPEQPATPPTGQEAAAETQDEDAREELDALMGSLPEGMKETFSNLIADIAAELQKIVDLLTEMGADGPAEEVAVAAAAGAVANTERTSTTPDSFEVLEDVSIPNIILRDSGLNIFTSGMPGADEDGTESTFNIDEARAGLTQLKEAHNIATVITLNGARDSQAYTELLTELGLNQIAYSTAFPEAGYLENVTDRAQMTQAQEEWNNPEFKRFISEASQAYQEGNILTHCEHGSHRSLALNAIMHAMDNPTKTYQEVINSTCSTSEATNATFLEYAGLIQYIAGNEALINELKSSVA